jgi:hypothetical protein
MSRGTIFSAVGSTMMRPRSTACRPSFSRGVAQRRFRDEAELHQQPPDRDVLLGLLEQRDAQLVLGQDALVDQDLAEMPLRLGIGRGIHRFNCATRASAPVTSKLAPRARASAMACL